MRNQKVMFLFLYTFLAMGMMLNGIVLAEEGDNNSDDSNTETASGSSDDSVDDVETTSDDSTEDVEDEVKTDRERLREIAEQRFEQRGERLKENLKKEFRENGAIVKVEREVEVQDDGSVKITIKRTIIDANGVERKIVIKIVEKDGERRVSVKDESKSDEDGEDNEIETELEIDDDFEGNQSDLEATTSDGEKHRIRVLPDEARQIIMERLKALNITNITLEEVRHKNIPQAVYQIETNKHGKFLGIFKFAMKIEGQVDPETGEVLDVNKPWWAILVAEQDEDVPPATDNSPDTILENTTSNESDIAA